MLTLARGTLSVLPLLMSMSEAFSVPFNTLIKLCYTKAHWKDWCQNWNSNTLATWCKELIHLKRPWCWEGLGAGGEGDDRGWDGWMASPTRWTWVWVDSGGWWWTGRPGVLRFMGSQRGQHDWATELNWHRSSWVIQAWSLVLKLNLLWRSWIWYHKLSP